MGFFDRLWPRKRAMPVPETALMQALVERLIVLSPSLKLASDYRERLCPALAQSIAYVSDIVERLPPAREASAANWLADPYIHAFFAAPDEVAHVLSRSFELHAWFESHPLARETWGRAGHGDDRAPRLRRRTARRPGAYRCRPDHAEFRRSSGARVRRIRSGLARAHRVQRVVEQIALEGLARIGTDESRRDALEQERALLCTRRQLLTRQGAGTQKMVGERAIANAAELAQFQAQIDANEQALAALGLKTDALEHEMGVICDVLGHPAQHANVEMKHVRLSPMNVVIERDAPGNGAQIVFALAHLPASPQGVRVLADPLRTRGSHGAAEDAGRG